MSPERFARINRMLDNRQPDLTICMEKVHKPNNLAAIVRTADAVGVSDVHAIWAEKGARISRNSSAGSKQWVDVHTQPDIQSAINHFHDCNMQVLVTNLSENAVDFREIDYTKPTVIILGNEKEGISDEALALADKHIIVPMVGMVQSLNVSVANSLILYEAQRQREAAGLYGKRTIDEATCQRYLFEGGYPIYAQQCKMKGLPYPTIDENGEIIADETWWHRIQYTSSQS